MSNPLVLCQLTALRQYFILSQFLPEGEAFYMKILKRSAPPRSYSSTSVSISQEKSLKSMEAWPAFRAHPGPTLDYQHPTLSFVLSLR